MTIWILIWLSLWLCGMGLLPLSSLTGLLSLARWIGRIMPAVLGFSSSGVARLRLLGGTLREWGGAVRLGNIITAECSLGGWLSILLGLSSLVLAVLVTVVVLIGITLLIGCIIR